MRTLQSCSLVHPSHARSQQTAVWYGRIGGLWSIAVRTLPLVGLFLLLAIATWAMTIGVTGGFAQEALSSSSRGIDAYNKSSVAQCDVPGQLDNPQCYDPPVTPTCGPIEAGVDAQCFP
jgi:hypothetical protein